MSLLSAAPLLIHQLTVRDVFEKLSIKDKYYAHYLARAAWHGARIIMSQVSPEATDIYELILEIHRSCGGDWHNLAIKKGVDKHSLDQWLEYAAKFLSNVGNYYGSGDQKFVPKVHQNDLSKLVSASKRAQELFMKTVVAMYAVPPYSLGFPNEFTQSMYYPGKSEMKPHEISRVSKELESRSPYLENTRISKTKTNGKVTYEVLIASIEKDESPDEIQLQGPESIIKIIRGDHCKELEKICFYLKKASEYAANDRQKQLIQKYIDSFRTGNLELYRDSQKIWVEDLGPRVENIFGFVEPYRDPNGIRAEFEGIVAISDAKETEKLKKLAQNSTKFIKRLPWAEKSDNDNHGQDPFEKTSFTPPDFISIHSLAYCSSIIFPGINLPNYNDIRQNSGFKNLIIANRMSIESNTSDAFPFIYSEEIEKFQKHKFDAYYIWVVLHELIGHGTGKMLIEEPAGYFNFDIKNRPVNPLTNSPITSWYRPGQTWTGQFKDLATTVDECRAELVGAYLMDDQELLGFFGSSESSEITASDLTYNVYLQMSINGLQGLQNYNSDTSTWGQAHSRAHFAILKCMLRDGDGLVTIDKDLLNKSIKVRVDRTKIISHGKPALGQMLLRLHIYRCTADVKSCKAYYEDLSDVDGEYLEWRSIVLAQNQPEWLFVHANTSPENNGISLKEYPSTKEGIIQSWAERDV